MEPLVALTAGDCECVELIAEAAQTIVVMPVERLLEPENVELLELARDGERPTKIPPLMPSDTRKNAGLIRVHHQLHAVTDGVAHRFDNREVVRRVRPVEAQFHRPTIAQQHLKATAPPAV